MKPKKTLALFLVMIMCISLVPTNVFAAANADGIELTKAATPAGDRTYAINLGVKGQNVSTQTPIDITLVFDISLSMDSSDRMAMTKQAAVNFINSVMASNGGTYNPAKDVRVSLVKFGTDARVYRFGSSAGWQGNVNSGSYYTNVASEATAVISSSGFVASDWGTNPEAGFMAAKAVTNSGKRGGSVPSYVIFMTDGVPNYRMTGASFSDGETGDVSRTADADFNEAVEAGKALKAAGNTVYTVGLLTGYATGSANMDCANYLLAANSSYKRTTSGRFGTIAYSLDGDPYTSSYTPITTTNVQVAAQQISDAYSGLAGTMTALAKGTVIDIVPSGFTVDEDSITLPPGAAKTVVVNPNGTTTITVSNVSAGAGTSSINYQVTANEGSYGSAYTNDNATYTYTLTSGGGPKTEIFPKPVVALAPVARNDSYTAAVNQPVTINVIENDSNVKLEQGGSATPLTVTDVSAAIKTSGGSGTGTVTSNPNGTLNFTATAPGTYTFTYRAAATVTIGGQAATLVKSTPATVTVTVSAQNMTVSADNVIVVYDGSDHGITVVPSQTGTTITYSNTENGTYTATKPTFINVTGGAQTVWYQVIKPGYTTVKGSATVTVTARPITLTAKSAVVDWTGAPLNVAAPGYEITAGTLAEGQSITSATVSEAQTEPGTYETTVGEAVIGENTSNYAITYAKGSLVINQLNMDQEVSAVGYEGVYDGTAHGITVTAPSGATVAYDVENSLTNVGEKTVTYTVTKPGYKTVTGSADIKITARPITLTAKSAVVDWTGAPLNVAAPGYEITAGTLAEGQSITSATVSEAQTEPGTYETTVGEAVIGENTSNYAITYAKGSLVINQLNMDQEVSAVGYEGVYDGTAHGITVTAPSGATVAYDVENSLTNVGEKTVTYTVTKPGYKTVTGSADIKITARPITLTAKSAVVDWTGAPLNVAAPGYEITAGTLAEGQSITSATVSEAQTEPGTYETTVGEAVIGENTSNYAITYAKGSLVINQLNMDQEVSAVGYEGVYDGTAHGITVTAPSGATVAYDVENSLTNVGEKTVTYTVTKPGYKTVTGSADIKITARPITLTAKSAVVDWTGAPLNVAAPGYEITAGTLAEGQSITSATVSEAQTEPGTYETTVGEAVIGENTSNYAITYAKGSLVINQLNMDQEVSAVGYEGVYDGTAHGITVTAPSGATVAYDVENSLTNVGEKTVTYTVTKPGYKTVTGSADIKITARPITLTAKSAVLDWTGAPLNVAAPGYEITAGTLAEGQSITSATVSEAQTEPGTYETTVGEAVIGENTSNYAITYAKGSLVINQLNMDQEVSAVGYEGVYDGTAHGITVTAPSGATVAYDVENSLTNVGEKTVTYTVTKPGYKTVTGSADIKITARPITLTAKSAVVDWTGAPLNVAAPGYEITAGTLAEGQSITSATVSEAQTEPGTYETTVGEAVIGENTSNYAITYAKGSLVINQLNMDQEVSAVGYEGVYDGTAHGITVTAPSGATVAYDVENSLTNVGEKTVTYTVTKPGYKTVTGSADIKITARPITLTAKSAVVDWTGAPLNVAAPGYEITAGTLAEGQSITSATVSEAQTEPGTYETTVGEAVIGENTSNYAITYAKGSLVINQLNMDQEVSAVGYEGVYDGTAHGITVTAPSGATVAYDVENSLTNVGEKTVTYTVTKPGYKTVTGSADIKITARPITLTAKSAVVDWTGAPLNVAAPGYEITAGTLAEGQSITSATVSEAQTEPGTYETTVGEAVIGENTSNYAITYAKGSLVINQLNMDQEVSAVGYEGVYDGTAHGITVTAPSGATVAYDVENSLTNVGEKTVTYTVTKPGYKTVTGSADIKITARPITLTAKSAVLDWTGAPLNVAAPGYEITAGTLAEGQSITSATVSEAQTEPGTYETTVGEAVIGENTSNYAITYAKGSLVINQLNMDQEVSAVGYEGVYDGTAHGITVTAPSGATVAYDVENSLTNVGEKTVTYTVTKPGYKTVTGSADIKITARPITLTAKSAVLDWTGAPLNVAAPGYEITAGTLAEGQSITSATVSEAQTEPGTYETTVGEAVIGENTSNYAITYAKGSLVINQLNMDQEVRAEGYEGVYDGVAREIKVTAPAGATVTYDLENSLTNAGNKTVVYTVTKPGYKTVTGSAIIKINQREITITANSNSKRYDGTPLTDSGYSVTTGTIAAGDKINSVTVTGTQTDRGEAVNTPKDAVIMDGETNVTSNYDIKYVNGTLTVTRRSSGGGGTTTIEDEEVPLGPILNMVDHYAYIQGYPDETVRPQGNITREEVAAVFFRLLDPTYRETIRTTEEDYSDVAESRWSVKHIGTLSNGQVLTGYADGSFRPGTFMTKAELATVASRFDALSEPGDVKFSDVSGHWAEKYILSAAAKGWVKGYEDGTFKPDQYITRAEFVTLVNNVLERRVHEENILPDAIQFKDLQKGKWYYEAMQEAINSHNYERAADSYEKWTEIFYPVNEM